MNIADLKHRITLQTPDDTPDAGGGVTRGWAEGGEVSASVETLSGGAQLRLSQLGARVTHRLVIRHRAGVAAGMRLVWNDAAYNIVFVRDPDGAGVWLEILAAQT